MAFAVLLSMLFLSGLFFFRAHHHEKERLSANSADILRTSDLVRQQCEAFNKHNQALTNWLNTTENLDRSLAASLKVDKPVQLTIINYLDARQVADKAFRRDFKPSLQICNRK